MIQETADPNEIPTSISSASVTSRVASGSAWLIAARLFTRVVDMVTLIALARALEPAAFGLVALAMSAIYIVEAVTELPLVTALVRLDGISRKHLDTSFTLGLLRGLALAVLLVGAAWPISLFYHDGRLFALICALSLAPAARGLVNPNLAVNAREIDFKIFFAMDAGGKTLSAIIAIAVAFAAHSYWAIAIYTIGAPVIGTVLSFSMAPYRPRLTLDAWPDFSRYLGWNTAAQILGAFNWQFDRLLLGRTLSKPDLGRYVMANDIAALPEQALVKPVGGPLFAGFAAAKGSIDRLRGAYLKADAGIFTVGLPMMLGLSAMAEPALRLGLGEKWISAAPMLQWLALTLVPPLAAAPMAALAGALDRPEFGTYRAIIESLVRLPLLIAGAWWMGVFGVIYARLLTDTVMSLVSMAIVRRLIGLSIAKQLSEIWRPLVAGAAMYAAVSLTRPVLHAASGVELIALSVLTAAGGAAIYVLLLLATWHASGRPESLERDVFHRVAALRQRR